MQGWLFTVLVAREVEIGAHDAQCHSLCSNIGFKMHIGGQAQVN